MEINNPAADSNGLWYGDQRPATGRDDQPQAADGYTQFEDRPAAQVAAVGDPGQFRPTPICGGCTEPGAVNQGDLGKPATGFHPDDSITGFNGLCQ